MTLGRRLGHGPALYLLERGEDVRDVRGRLTERERGRLRGQGKSDPRDAYAIARVTAREELAPVRNATPDRDLKLLGDYRQQLLSARRAMPRSPSRSSRSRTRASRPRRHSASASRRSTGASSRRSRPSRPSGARG